MCAFLLIRGGGELERNQNRVCSNVFTRVCNAIQTFIFHSLATRIGFVALILLLLWAQNTLNMEDWLLSKIQRL